MHVRQRKEVKAQRLFNAMGQKVPSWFQTKDFRLNDGAANPELRMGFAITGPLATSGFVSHADGPNPVYTRNNILCPACNVFRSQFEFGYGAHVTCRGCRKV